MDERGRAGALVERGRPGTAGGAASRALWARTTRRPALDLAE